MEVYLSIVIFIFGTIFGSFYNVVGYRLPNGLSLIKPGSFCPKCNHELKWYELFPIFSFLVQKGRCRKCKCKISLFYPLIEFTTGVLFLVSYLIFGISTEFFISIIISSFFVIVIVSDFNYLIISDEVTIFMSILIVLITFFSYGIESGIYSIVFGLILFAFMFLFMLMGNKIFKKETLGGGDIKLMFFIGTVLNPWNGLFSLFIASISAFPVSLIFYMKRKSRVIPFGPFLLFGCLIVYLFQLNILSILGLS